MSTKYEETIIERKAYKPEFHIEQKSTSYGTTYNVPVMHLKPKNESDAEYKLSNKPLGRFLAFHSIGRNKFVRMCYRDEDKINRAGKTVVHKVFIGTDKANDWILDHYAKIPTEKFKILLADGNVARITSDKYISIPHNIVQSTIENRLKAEGFKFTKNISSSGQRGQYRLLSEEQVNKAVNVGDKIADTVCYFNRNSGDKSLHIAGGSEVLICSNGMTTVKNGSKIRMLHKLDLKVVKRRIEETLTEILKNVKPLRKIFTSLQKVVITETEAKKFVEVLPYPKYMQQAIWTRLFTKSAQTSNEKMDWDGTLWGIYMASTYIASHHEEMAKGRRSVQIDDDMRQRLSTVETFSETWDKREELLEKKNAPKIEAKK